MTWCLIAASWLVLVFLALAICSQSDGPEPPPAESEPLHLGPAVLLEREQSLWQDRSRLLHWTPYGGYRRLGDPGPDDETAAPEGGS